MVWVLAFEIAVALIIGFVVLRAQPALAIALRRSAYPRHGTQAASRLDCRVEISRFVIW
jgi:hypothetical protein